MRTLLVATAVFLSRMRLLPANVSPLGSFGFFGQNPFIYFATIILFDSFVGGHYHGFWWTYAGFAAYPLFGYLARKHWRHQALLLPLASFSFYLLSNFGSFWYWYPHTLEGLLLCYALALPFYLRTLSGDLLFGYGYLLFKHRATLLSKITNKRLRYRLKTQFGIEG